MSYLTSVRCVFIRNQVNIWLRFGRPLKQRVIDPFRRDAYFTPHAIFGIVTWRGSVDGAAMWRIDILRAVAPSERASEIVGVTPGAEILLRTASESNVRTVFALIDGIEARHIQLDAVSPDYWRCAHNRLAAGEAPPALMSERHGAYLSRSKRAP